MVGFALVLARLVNLHILQAAELTQRAERQHWKAVTLEGSRGTIYDRNGKVLAINVEVPSAFGVPTALGDLRTISRRLSPVLNLRPRDLEKKLRQDRHFVWLARKLDPEQGRRLQALELDGIGVVMEGRRFYPKGPLLAHVLGFAGMDGEGLEGIERRYDKYLRGDKQIMLLERDALGRTVLPRGVQESGPDAGRHVTLTVDEVVQYITEQELEAAVESTRAKGGMAVVMEPNSGAILAMAVNPRFDPNVVKSLSPDRWRNRTIADTFEPGSTMKVFMGAAALEEHVASPTTSFFGEFGQMTVANTVIHDHEKIGWMTFAEMIHKSSNIGAAKAAMRLGEQRLYAYLRKFGFGERTDADLPGEVSGLLRPTKQWGRRSLASIAMGQEIGVTALQLASAISAIANGGSLMKPYVVSEVHDSKGRVLAQMGPQLRRQVVSQATAQAMTTILEGVVTDGTGTKAAVPGIRVAGKTGTAQKVDPRTGAYSSTMVVGSFVGFAPAEDPRVTIVVVVDEPQVDAWGGAVAAPAFRRIAEQVLPHLGVTSSPIVKIAMATTESPLCSGMGTQGDRCRVD
ncbi:penicillin-binding protein [Nitrospira sp.]|nr:penicillin-binding protein [Nitrospira sp.]